MRHLLPRCIFSPTYSRTLATRARLPLPERLRRKIWGSDAPPGLSDPYTPRPVPPPTNSAPPNSSSYVEAIDGRGLGIVGLEEIKESWVLPTYGPVVDPIIDTEDLHRAMHRAVVETLTLRINGQDPATAFTSSTPTADEKVTEHISVNVDADGQIRIEFSGIASEEAVLRGLEPVNNLPNRGETLQDGQGEAEEEVEVKAEDLPSGLEPIKSRPQWLEQGLTGEGWVLTPLLDDEIKFAIMKRLVHLTGRRLPDRTTTQSRTIADLIISLVAPPKPKRLADELAQIDNLVRLPNVKLFASRIRPLDKERVIGRARPLEKVVDYEYHGIDRPLPVFRGHVIYR